MKLIQVLTENVKKIKFQTGYVAERLKINTFKKNHIFALIKIFIFHFNN